MTVADTIFDTIADNWGNGGYAGVTPAIDTIETQTQTDLGTVDVIEVRSYSVRENPKPVNDTYTNKYFTIDVYISSKTSAAQLKLIVDETEYLLRNTTMTSLQLVNITIDYSVSMWNIGKHAAMMKVEVVSFMVSGAITPAAGSTASIQALLMYGASNAAWVPCPFLGGNNVSDTGYYAKRSTGANGEWGYEITLPLIKGSLKLYCVGYRTVIGDADANNYVTQRCLVNLTNNGLALMTDGVTTLDNTDLTAQGTDEHEFASVRDCSSYEAVGVWINVVSNAANNLDIHSVQVKVYYDT